jgi:hypothetical protein
MLKQKPPAGAKPDEAEVVTSAKQKGKQSRSRGRKPQPSTLQEISPEKLKEDFGSANRNFIEVLLRQIGYNARDEGTASFILSVISGIKPRDEIEAMLATHLALVHTAAMKFPRHFDLVETLPQQDSAERTLNKLLRTFIMLTDALKRYRTGGEQKVLVQHVTVREGGNAIVANVTSAGTEAPREETRSPTPLIEHSNVTPMPELKRKKERAFAPVRRRVSK